MDARKVNKIARKVTSAVIHYYFSFDDDRKRIEKVCGIHGSDVTFLTDEKIFLEANISNGCKIEVVDNGHYGVDYIFHDINNSTNNCNTLDEALALVFAAYNMSELGFRALLEKEAPGAAAKVKSKYFNKSACKGEIFDSYIELKNDADSRYSIWIAAENTSNNIDYYQTLCWGLNSEENELLEEFDDFYTFDEVYSDISSKMDMMQDEYGI